MHGWAPKSGRLAHLMQDSIGDSCSGTSDLSLHDVNGMTAGLQYFLETASALRGQPLGGLRVG